MAPRADLLQGTLDLLIVKTLVLGSLHGGGISKRLLQISGDVRGVGPGSPYPARSRLEARGWVSTKWGTIAESRHAKPSRLPADGRRQLAVARPPWRPFSAAVDDVLSAT